MHDLYDLYDLYDVYDVYDQYDLHDMYDIDRDLYDVWGITVPHERTEYGMIRYEKRSDKQSRCVCCLDMKHFTRRT